MPATAVQSAQYTANIYTACVVAERRLLTILSARPRDRAVIEDALDEVRDVARDAYGRYRGLILELLAGEHAVQAGRIVLDVQRRIKEARTPLTITISKD
jgi:hypothetical protein